MNLNKSKAIALGTVFGAVSCVLLLTFFSISFVKMKKLPYDIIGVIIIFCAAVGSFFSGYISLRILRKNGLLYGTVAGVVLFIILTIASLLASGGQLTSLTLYKGISMMTSGALGGVVGVNKRSKARW